MVGHTGVFGAAVKAAEAVDSCVGTIIDAALAHGYTSLILADHGNSDYMINDDGSPNTQHSLNPVPLIVVDAHFNGVLRPGRLANIAPTILKLMGIEKPSEMNEESLL